MHIHLTTLFFKYSLFCDHVSSKTPHFKTFPLNTFQFDWGLYPDTTLSNRRRHHSDKPMETSITMIPQELLSCDTMGSIQWACKLWLILVWYSQALSVEILHQHEELEFRTRINLFLGNQLSESGNTPHTECFPLPLEWWGEVNPTSKF